MKSLEELAAIRDKMQNVVNLRSEASDCTRIVVGMATCGIARLLMEYSVHTLYFSVHNFYSILMKFYEKIHHFMVLSVPESVHTFSCFFLEKAYK